MKTLGYGLQVLGILAGIAAVILSLFFGVVTAIDATTAAGMAAGILLAFFCETIGFVVAALIWIPGRALTDSASERELRSRLLARRGRIRGL